ncbi:MAG: chemotaxis-specific protein-glutamate methyltransferase CheB [Deltaproteobacteria bacterium]|nr:chemotaxis-specific protein-glutamate methyltransferase CheB [Deltaproteobacteria bacterium]
MLRVLVVDDSPTVRALLADILQGDPEITVVGEARDGVEAVEMAKRFSPQLVTMDVHMPRMDGLEATKAIMLEAPTRIIIVTASLDEHEVATSLQALRAGALCVLRKPPGPAAPGHASESRQLLETVRAMAEVKVPGHTRAAEPAPVNGGTRVVALAASTGGPGALHRILSELPCDFGVPVLAVQHMSRGFIPGLVSWLNAGTALRVKIAEAGEALAPGVVYLAPDGRHLGVGRGVRVTLSDEAPVRGFRPAASYLFESVAHAFGFGVVAAILTGMGDDGVVGLGAVRRAGGYVLAQDEPSSVVFGMPGAAVAAGVVDEVLPLRDVSERLLALLTGPRLRSAGARSYGSGGNR